MKYADIRAAGTECGNCPKPMPIGVSDFCSAATDYYYVDKTLMISDFHLCNGFLTGILRIAKESIFSGLNSTVWDQGSAINRAAIPKERFKGYIKKNELKQIRNKQYQAEMQGWVW